MQIPQLVINYSQLLPYFGFAFVLSLLLTPWAGKLSVKIGAMDIPARLLGRDGKNLEKHINNKITPRLGGLAMVAAIIIVVGLDPQVGIRWGIIAGMLVLTVIGVLDDAYDIAPKWQFAGQFVAAAMVIVSGITITSIQLAGVFIDLNLFSTPVTLGNLTYFFIWPADIITLIWIVAIVNFVNWTSAIDGLNGALSSVAGVAMMLIAMRSGNLPLAILTAIFVGAVLGVLPFNYHPSKIFYGFGEYINGFLLAVFGILIGSKLAVSIIVLGIPIIDALWVMSTRLLIKPEVLLRPWQIPAILIKSDRNHLHHRLLAFGFSWKGVLMIELAIMIILCSIAFYFSDFSNEFLVMLISLAVLLVLFALIAILLRRVKQQRAQKRQQLALQPKMEVVHAQDQAAEAEKFRY